MDNLNRLYAFRDRIVRIASCKAYMLPAAALGLTLGIWAGRYAGSFIPGIIALILSIAGVITHSKKGFAIALVVFCTSIGFLCSYHAWNRVLPEEDTYRISGVISDELTLRDGDHVRTRLTDVRLNGTPAGSDVYWTFYLTKADNGQIPADMLPGRAVSFTGSLYHPSDAQNPGGFDFRAYLLGQGITIGVYGYGDGVISSPDHFSLFGWAAAIRHQLILLLNDRLGPEAGSYASAMLLGCRSLIDEDDLDAFSHLGIAHILSVSGFHVGVLAALLTALLAIFPKHISQYLRMIFLPLVLGFYCLLTGCHPPVLRASMILVIGLYGRFRGRRYHLLWPLAFSWCVLLLVNPANLFQAGFLMTYGAVTGILLLTPKLQTLVYIPSRPIRWLWNSLCVSIAAQFGLLLPMLWFYQEIPLLGIILNIFVVSFTSLLMSVYYLSFLPFVPLITPFIGAAGRIMTGFLTAAVHQFDQWPAAILWAKQCNWLTFIGWCIVIAACYPVGRFSSRPWKKPASIGILLIFLSLIPLPHLTTDYVQFSVGSADAALIWDKDTVTVVDTGETGEEIGTYLHQHRLGIDKLFISHLHTDHAGGIQGLIDKHIPVRELYLPAGWDDVSIQPKMASLVTALEQNGTKIFILQRGDSVSLPSGMLDVLWPEEGCVRSGQDANLYSMASRLTLYDTQLLLTGDLDGIYENYAAVPADILKAAHHGSGASTGSEFLEAVSPSLVLISGGDQTRLESMKEKVPGITVLGTQEHGALMLRFNPKGYTVTAMR